MRMDIQTSLILALCGVVVLCLGLGALYIMGGSVAVMGALF